TDTRVSASACEAPCIVALKARRLAAITLITKISGPLQTANSEPRNNGLALERVLSISPQFSDLRENNRHLDQFALSRSKPKLFAQELISWV
ncbi:MAG: hypothetical protein ACJ8LM_16995, partial [Candidatus Udaeobacter sp.]